MSGPTPVSPSMPFWKTRDDLQNYQRQALRSLLKYLWPRSPFYRQLYEAHGLRETDIDHVRIEDLPCLSKQTLTENFDFAVTDPRLQKAALEQWILAGHGAAEDFLGEFVIVHSSGTSGYRTFFPYDRISYNVMTSVMVRYIAAPKRSRKTKVAIYRGSHGNFGSVVSAVRMPKSTYEVLLLSLLEPTQRTIDQLNVFQPDRLDGHASSVAWLADQAGQGKLRIRPEQIIVSGDALTGSMERIITSAWSAPVWVLYTCSESFCLALRELGQTEMTVLDDLNIAEVLDSRNRAAAPGDSGRVVITNLFNYALPVLRYELRDYAVRADFRNDSPCTRIRHLVGRESDALPVMLDDGSEDRLNPLILHEFCETGLQNEYRVSALDSIQFISKGPDWVQIRYTSGESLDAEVRHEFQRLLNNAGAGRTQFDVVRVGRIEPNPQTGKHSLVRLELAPAVEFHTPSVATSPRIEGAVGGKTAHPPSIKIIEQSIPERFERLVENGWDRPAVKTASRTFTYGQLNRFANRVAHTVLRAAGPKPEAVALLCEQNAYAIAAIFGVLKAGKFYVPLDDMHPAARLASILADAEAKLILTDNKNAALARGVASGSSLVINIEALPSDVGDLAPKITIASKAFAFMIFTSGTTGEPKGVIQNHCNTLHNAMTFIADLSIRPDDRISLLRHFSVFGANRHIFGALLSGAALFPFDVRQEGIAGLAAWLEAEKITDCFFGAPLFRYFLDTLTGREQFTALRVIELGSDAVHKQDIARFQELFPSHCVLINGLSSTEAGTVRRYRIDKNAQIPTATVPVGYPVADIEVLLLDESGHPVPPGETGEIVVRSRYLSPGYWRRPDLTRAVFSNDPDDLEKRLYRTGDHGRLWADGLLEHLGRQDTQVKISGYRVAFTEVERALLNLGIISDAVVNSWVNPAGDTRLVAYLVPANRTAPSARTLTRELRHTLPPYMIPSFFVALDEIPRNANGKVDRQTLPAPDRLALPAENRPAPPCTPIEKFITEIWSEILDLDVVSIYDDFLELGGNSLQATQVIARLRRAYGITVPFRDFFEKPTIANLALLVLAYLTSSAAHLRSSKPQAGGR